MDAEKGKICIATFLALSTTLMVCAIVGILCFVTISDGNRTILQGVIVTVVAQWITVIGFYFGSSQGSAKKTDALLDKPKE